MKLKFALLSLFYFASPNRAHSNVSHTVNAGTKTYFINTNSSNISKLWVTSGTKSSTKEAYPDSPTIPVLSITGATKDLMIGLNEKVIFKASNSTAGEELWVSDGTPAGTFMLKDINSGPSGSAIQNFMKLGNKAIFLANDGIHEQELWITDGTSAGTNLVKDLGTGYSLFSNTDDWKVLNNKLYFGRQSSLIWPELWVTDGSAAGTKNIKTHEGNGMYNPNKFMAHGNIVYFLAVDGLNTKYIYATDDTQAGTVPIAHYFVSTPVIAQALNNRLFFRHPDPNMGSDMWVIN